MMNPASAGYSTAVVSSGAMSRSVTSANCTSLVAPPRPIRISGAFRRSTPMARASHGAAKVRSAPESTSAATQGGGSSGSRPGPRRRGRPSVGRARQPRPTSSGSPIAGTRMMVAPRIPRSRSAIYTASDVSRASTTRRSFKATHLPSNPATASRRSTGCIRRSAIGVLLPGLPTSPYPWPRTRRTTSRRPELLHRSNGLGSAHPAGPRRRRGAHPAPTGRAASRRANRRAECRCRGRSPGRRARRGPQQGIPSRRW